MEENIYFLPRSSLGPCIPLEPRRRKRSNRVLSFPFPSRRIPPCCGRHIRVEIFLLPSPLPLLKEFPEVRTVKGKKHSSILSLFPAKEVKELGEYVPLLLFFSRLEHSSLDSFSSARDRDDEVSYRGTAPRAPPPSLPLLGGDAFFSSPVSIRMIAGGRSKQLARGRPGPFFFFQCYPGPSPTRPAAGDHRIELSAERGREHSRSELLLLFFLFFFIFSPLSSRKIFFDAGESRPASRCSERRKIFIGRTPGAPPLPPFSFFPFFFFSFFCVEALRLFPRTAFGWKDLDCSKARK